MTSLREQYVKLKKDLDLKSGSAACSKKNLPFYRNCPSYMTIFKEDGQYLIHNFLQIYNFLYINIKIYTKFELYCYLIFFI